MAELHVDNREKVERAYIFCVILAFGLLFFANAEAQDVPDGTVVELGIGKLFYIPCALAFVLSFFLYGRGGQVGYKFIKRTDQVLLWLVLSCLISTIVSPPQDLNVLGWATTRFIAAIVCFKDLRRINPNIFISFLTIASPLIVIPHYFLSNPFAYGMNRYGGFYGDPNFLAISLNFLITICYLSYKTSKNKLILVASVVSILGSIPLILLGVSRAGIMGLCVVLFFIMRDIRRKEPKVFAAILMLFVISFGHILIEFSDIFEFIRLRFSNEDPNDEYGAYARIEVIQSVINVFWNRPDLILFGIGPGNTMLKISEYRMYGYTFSGAVHNTFFLILYEMGIICTICYMLLYFSALKRLFHYKNYLLFGLLLTVILSLATLPGITFMPAWILLFFLMNPRTIVLAKG